MNAARVIAINGSISDSTCPNPAPSRNTLPLPQIVDICKHYGAAIMVDDAHGIGVLGEGRGTARHFGREFGVIS